MRRTFLLLVTTIAAITVCSVAIILIVVRPGSPSRDAAAPVEPASPDDARGPAAAAPTGPAGIAAPTAKWNVEVTLGPPAPAVREGTWEAVAPVARPAALGPVGAAIGRELNELHPRLSACFDEDTAARHGTQPITAVQDAAPTPDMGATVLMLQVESSGGTARIVDAPVETRGGASDGVIACAQHVLRGRTIAVPEEKAGTRHRILYTLLQ